MPSAPPLADLKQADLLQLVAHGDRDAFARLFNLYAPRVAMYLVRGGTSPAAAEELAQEAMLQVWRKASSFDASRGAVSTWIYTIARNLRNDRWRIRPELEFTFGEELDDVVGDGESPEDRIDCRELHDRLHSALDNLTPEHARLVRLCYLSERPQFEVARDLELPLSTVKSRIRVALTHLRRILDADRP